MFLFCVAVRHSIVYFALVLAQFGYLVMIMILRYGMDDFVPVMLTFICFNIPSRYWQTSIHLLS